MSSQRRTIRDALLGLLVAENGGDVIEEVFTICDCLGLDRPEWDGSRQRYVFAWESADGTEDA